MSLATHLLNEHTASGAPSGAQTPSLTHIKRNPDLQALRQGTDDGGIDTPGHAHHFANKGIDPAELSGTLKKHIAKGAHEGERKLNDFSADPTERLNPHFAKALMKDVDLEDQEEPRAPDSTPAPAAEESKS
ncbi:hypothetical protein CPB86DRAFT_783163 [Serendipita vermifera]|nr:hypothetical protein CPB86DRAFT_783163 [Serendipita vermifera]